MSNDDSDKESSGSSVMGEDITEPTKSQDVSSSLVTGPQQPILNAYAPRMFGNKRRDFSASWYEKYPWISYDINEKRVVCWPCREFMNDSFDYTDWKKTETFKTCP
jgi:hypothetical protein